MNPVISSSVRQLPQVLVATLVVVACPAAAVLALGASGLVTSTLDLSLIAIALSVAVSAAGSAAWKRRAASGDLLFGDLMLWGWLRRWRFERLLSHTAALVGSGGFASGDELALGRARRARLLERLSRALEARDPHTHGHSRRVARHAAAIAKRMSLSAEEVARIRMAAILHDVGKIDTPREILEKRGPLSEAEYEVVKRHAPVGAGMVAALGDPELTAIVRSHHERLDGGGYPDGLAGEQIPLGARVIAVADTFDAVTSGRPYRRPMAHRRALALLTAAAGTQLDPAAVRGFNRYYSGHRFVAFWATLLALPRQAGFLLLDLPRFGSALTGAKVAVASLATVAVGSAVVLPPGPAERAASGGESRQQPAAVASGSTAPLATRRDPGRQQGGQAAAEVSGPALAKGSPPPSSAEPVPVASQPGTTTAGSPGSEETSAPASSPSSPANSGSGAGSQPTAAPAAAPVEVPAAPAAAPVSSSVNQTVQGVGSTVEQVLAPTVESVNGVLEQTTGGLLGGG